MSPGPKCGLSALMRGGENNRSDDDGPRGAMFVLTPSKLMRWHN